MSERSAKSRQQAARRLPLKAWLLAALLFVFGIRLLTAGER